MKYAVIEQSIFDAMQHSRDFALNDAEYSVLHGTRDTFVKFLDIKIKSLQIEIGNMQHVWNEGKVYAMIQGFDLLKEEISNLAPITAIRFDKAEEDLE